MQVLRMLLVVMVLGLGGQGISAAQESGHGVPMFGGDPARTGVMPGPGPDPANGIAGRWRFATESKIGSSPAVVDGVVYVGSLDGRLYAIDAASGAERWRVATKDGIYSSPAVVDGMVYVGSFDGNLYAVDAASGEERWRFATGDVITSSPAVAGGVVYVGSNDGNLYAVGARQLVIEAGGQAVVREDAVLRGAPAPSGVERAALEQGTAVAIVDESVTTAGEVWWPVRVAPTGEQGWVRAAELEPTANTPQATATAGP